MRNLRLCGHGALLTVLLAAAAASLSPPSWAEDSGPPAGDTECPGLAAKVQVVPRGGSFDLAHPPRFTLTGLEEWLRCRKASSSDLRLFLSGKELVSSRASQIEGGQGIEFPLKRIDREEEAWKSLLDRQSLASVRASVAIGLHGDKSPLSDPVDLDLTLVNVGLSRFAFLGLLVALVAAYYLARFTGMLRDEVPGRPARERPYSLARVQMAIWTFLVLGGTVFVSLVQSRITDIPPGLLGLIGISAGTFVAAQMAARGDALEKPSKGRGVIKDLLADSNGEVTLHRFQMILWTVASAWMFIADTAGKLALPDLPANLQGLMGISSGIYLGFRFKEDPKP